jgi:hypothetical protein
MKYNLYRWSVSAIYDNPYAAPEAGFACLVGHRNNEERRVRTSAIVSVKGREVTTFSGSVYILQDIDQNYRKFLEENNLEYDPEDPIKLRK